MQVKKTIIFDEQEKQTMKDMIRIIKEICSYFDESKCSQCPFRKICDVADLESIFIKLVNEGQVIVK